MKSSAVYGSIARLGETICTRQDLYKYLTMHFFLQKINSVSVQIYILLVIQLEFDTNRIFLLSSFI
jgi:hypothetical protein